MILAAIDVGTNTIKTAVGEQSPGGVRIIMEKSIQARLGKGVDASGLLAADSIGRASDAICSLWESAKEAGAQSARVAATSAVRDAANRQEFIDEVKNRCGLDVEVLPEEEECRYSYLAIALDPSLGGFAGSQAVMDVGGGSTEFSFGVGAELGFHKSVKLGAVRLTERFISSDPPSASELQSACEHIREVVSEVAEGRKVERVVAVGGSAVNLGRIFRNIPPEQTKDAHGIELTSDALGELLNCLVSLPLESRKLLVGIEPERADILPAGVLIYNEAVSVLGSEGLAISTRGLRHGVLYEMLGKE